MPSTKGQGQSESTPLKQEGLKSIFVQHLAICSNNILNRSWTNSVYHYIDMNAGSGNNSAFGCKGSPIIFWEAASLLAVRHKAYLIEIEPVNVIPLKESTAQWKDCKVLLGDNTEWTPRIIRSLPQNTFGILYHDPNGIPDFELLAYLSEMSQSSTLDFLIRCPANALKRNYHQRDVKLVESLKTIKKEHWIIQEPEGKWQWTFLLGLNTDKVKAWKSKGFHYVHSKRGQEIIRRLNYTKDELDELRQPTLF